MSSRGTLISLVLILFASIKDPNAQDYVSSEPLADRTIALCAREDADSKEAVPSGQTQPAESQNWLFHVQATEIGLGQPGFRSPYKGTNSIPPDDDFRQTSTFNVYLGAWLWPGGEAYVDVGYYQGFGFANTHGVAAFPNAEGSKVGQTIGDGILPHLFFRQTFGFGREQEGLKADQPQLREKVDISRLTFTIGRLTTGDQSRRVTPNRVIWQPTFSDRRYRP